MAALKEASASQDPFTQVPEWETPSNYNPGSNDLTPARAALGANPFLKLRTNVSTFLDRRMPSHRTYWGFRRRTVLIVIAFLLVALLALIIGLAVGLSSRSSQESLFLPLPSDKNSFTGDLTYYDSTGLGSCGIVLTDNDPIVAVSHFLYDKMAVGSNPNNNPLCGLKIRAERFDEQVNAKRSVDLTVMDRCTGCQPKDIDVSPAMFSKLADPVKGRVDVTWAWLSPEPT